MLNIFKNLTLRLIAIYLETVGDKRVTGFKYQRIVNIYDKFQLLSIFCFHNKNMEFRMFFFVVGCSQTYVIFFPFFDFFSNVHVSVKCI